MGSELERGRDVREREWVEGEKIICQWKKEVCNRELGKEG